MLGTDSVEKDAITDNVTAEQYGCQSHDCTSEAVILDTRRN